MTLLLSYAISTALTYANSFMQANRTMDGGAGRGNDGDEEFLPLLLSGGGGGGGNAQ